MKIGIISRQRIVNYGSFLQAYGLKNTFESMGHQVHFIDYRDENGKLDYAQPYDSSFYHLRSLYHYIRNPKENRFYSQREYLFKKKLIKQLEITPEYVDDYDCDAVVIGSDEIFSICEDSPWGQSPSMMGSLVKDDQKLLSYAASFGYTTEEKIKDAGIYDMVSNLLNRFDALSVRDMNSFSIVKNLTGKEPSKNLDPVLIYDYSNLLPKKTKFKNYIVLYGYDYRIKDEYVINAVKAFANKNNLKIIALGMEQSWADVNYLAEPFELLAMIRDAKYVVTDTFHGTVFSIKFQKQFATIVRDNNKQKLLDLLDTFGLADRLITEESNVEKVLTAKYDREKVQRKIDEERKSTMEYFQNNL